MVSTAELSQQRLDWILFHKTFAGDRTSRVRPRPLLTTAKAEERRRRLGGTKHREEWASFRKLLVDPVPQVLMRFHEGGAPAPWGHWGKYLRVVGPEDPVDRFTLVNEERPCLNLLECFPHWCAVGSRPLESGPGLKNRLLFEVFFPEGGRLGEADFRLTEVGVCAVDGILAEVEDVEHGDLTNCTCLERISYSSHGSLASTLPVASFNSPEEGGGSVLRQVAGAASANGLGVVGLRPWPGYGEQRAWVAMEVDLEQGELSVARLRSQDSARWGAAQNEGQSYFRIPALRPTLDSPIMWLPFVALTGVRQRARLLEFHVVTSADPKTFF